MARPVPVEPSRGRVSDIEPSAARQGSAPGTTRAIDVTRPYDSERTLLQTLISLAGAAGIALMVPFAILLVGFPIAVAARGLFEVLAWLFPAPG